KVANREPDNLSSYLIVMCLSCHRAHGTPNNDLLRWAYTMDAGSGTDNGGCFICHTTKGDL
ncbi:MAG: hypothetical protein KAU38_15015, partial [Desulfobacterales bacterium]|nr:hypothetical protein [Desulfobacterales bacterium]